MKHSHWCNTHMYIEACNHTHHTPFKLFITWQLVSTSSVGHHQVILQEHECIQNLSTIRHEISPFSITNTLNIFIHSV